MKELAKNAIKKMGAVVLGTAMLGATVFSAVAADLGDYPSPFVKSGVFNGEIVVGNDAKVADVVGAIDVAASLQYAMKVAGAAGSASSEGGVVTVETGSASVAGGVKVEATGDKLNIGEDLKDTKATYTDNDLDILADGEVKDEDSTTGVDYTQKLTLIGAADVQFDRSQDNDAFGDEPGFHIDFPDEYLYKLTVDFMGTVNASALDDSEEIVIAGKTYTFDPNQGTGDLILLGAKETIILELGESKEISGAEYTLMGANADNNNAILKVGSSQKTVTQGNTYSIGGQDVYIKSLYITTIPTTSASLELFVGSEEMKISDGALDVVKVNSEDVDGVYANYTGTIGAIEEINFVFNPTDRDLDGEEKFLKLGESIEDPLFGTFKIEFAGMSEENMAKSRKTVSLDRKGDYVDLTFSNIEGKEQKISAWKYNSTNGEMIFGDKLSTTNTSIPRGNSFIAKNGAGNVWQVYKLKDVYKDGTSYKADFETDGKTVTVLNNTALQDVGNMVLDYSAKTVTLGTPNIVDFNGTPTITAEYDVTIGFQLINSSTIRDGTYVNVTEAQISNPESIAQVPLQFDITSTGATGDKQLTIGGPALGTENEDGDEKFAVTAFGTYATWGSDADNDGYAKVYYTEEAVTANVYIAPTGAGTTQATKEYSEGDVLAGIGTIKAITAGTITGGSFNVNKIALPLAKLDVDTTLGSTNQIIVGGPAVNKLAAEAVGVTYPSYGLSSGMFEGAGEAVLKLVETGTKVAIVVAGWEAADTQRATSVLANYDKYSSKLKGAEVKITGTISSPEIELVVAEETTE
jgi:hypothetical protein